MQPTRTLTASDEDEASHRAVAAHYLILALDCARPTTPPVRLHLDGGPVIIGRGAQRAWTRSADGTLHIRLPGAWVSGQHARLSSTAGGWLVEDGGSKNGTFRNGVRLERAILADGDVLEVGGTLLVYRALTHAGVAHDEAAAPAADGELPRTLNPSWSSVLTTLLRVSRTTASILLIGETGTGKEVVARAVHAASGRRGPFVPVNCGAIVRTLVESELFGVKKGAYSGATDDRVGLVRSAEGGTLFLDEVAELPEASQVALLRVLQEHEVLPVGATRAVAVDLRVVAATREDLAARVADGRFRADLHSRLAGHVTHLPPLRARIEDVGVLIAELLPRLAGERADRLAVARPAARALFRWSWPYNVRELEQALRSALAVADGDELGLADLPEQVRADSLEDDGPKLAVRDPEIVDGAAAERERIVAALESCAWNQTRAARVLGISRATLVNKIALLGLPRPRKR